MDRFRELATFVAVAEDGAFNAAARRLNLSPPAVTRLITALEARLGTRLFARTTRQVSLTDAGDRFYAAAARILADLAAAEGLAAGSHDAPHGVLRVTAPVMFGQRFITPILRDFLDRHPAVTAEALFVDRIVDLIDEGLDVALRIGELPDSNLAATRVGAVRRVVIASAAYVAGNGTPNSPADLHGHRLVLPTGTGALPVWDFVAAGARHSVRVRPVLRVNTMVAAIDAARAGWGITRALSYQVADDIAAGDLVELLVDCEDRQLPVRLVQPEGRQAAAKIRAFIDLAAARLRQDAGRLIAQPPSRPEGG